MNRRCIPIRLAQGLLTAALVAVSPMGWTEGIWAGVYTEAQAQNGRQLFATHCSACHADVAGQVGGHGPAPAVLGDDFRDRWLDAAVLDIFDTIRQTMPEAAPNSLSAEEYADLTAYVLRINGYPAGDQLLRASDRQRLLEIYLEAAE